MPTLKIKSVILSKLPNLPNHFRKQEENKLKSAVSNIQVKGFNYTKKSKHFWYTFNDLHHQKSIPTYLSFNFIN